MILERAVVQMVVRDAQGMSVVADCPRPDHVRSIAERLRSWKQSPEGCHQCQRRNAVAFMGRPLCAECRGFERRLGGFEIHDTAVRRARRADDSDSVLKGYAIVFDKKSVNLGGFVEAIRPGAFDRTVTENIDVRYLADHDSSKVLGRKSAGTLQFQADKFGVYVQNDPPDTSYGRDVAEVVSRRDVSGQSFGFATVEDDWSIKDEMPFREVLDMRVMEFSVVGFPAYPQTSVEVGERGGARSVVYLSRVLQVKRAR